MSLVLGAVALLLALAPDHVLAAPITFFGEDLGLGDAADTPLASTPNADAAQAAFLATLLNPGVETFEDESGSFPLAISFANGVTATLTGGGFVEILSDTDTDAGRYGVTGDADPDERFWRTEGGENAFTITFSSPVSAFGFYGVDIGDFDGQVTATTAGGLNQVFNIGNSTSIEGGSVLFWGVIDPDASFISVAFGNTGSGDDIFGFDDFTIGTPEQVVGAAVPEPATLVMFGSGLALTAAVLRHRARRSHDKRT
jgi:hypothetical protein